MTPNPIVPSLWFYTDGGQVSTVLSYYESVFGSHFQRGEIMDLGETPSGHTELCQVSLFGQKYSMMATAQAHESFTDALGLTIECQDQDEIDHYWDSLTREGREIQCGWCHDRFGLRWQIIPKHLGELMKRPNAWETMMRQKKIIISEY